MRTTIAEVLTEMDLELAALERRREKTRPLKQGLMPGLLTPHREDAVEFAWRRHQPGGEIMSDAPLPQSEIILCLTEDSRTRIQRRFELEHCNLDAILRESLRHRHSAVRFFRVIRVIRGDPCNPRDPW